MRRHDVCVDLQWLDGHSCDSAIGAIEFKILWQRWGDREEIDDSLHLRSNPLDLVIDIYGIVALWIADDRRHHRTMVLHDHPLGSLIKGVGTCVEPVSTVVLRVAALLNHSVHFAPGQIFFLLTEVLRDRQSQYDLIHIVAYCLDGELRCAKDLHGGSRNRTVLDG